MSFSAYFILYGIAAFWLFYKMVVPLGNIGHQRQSTYHEDLQQMHWERCTLAALPYLGSLLLLLLAPVYLLFEGSVLAGVLDKVIDVPLLTTAVIWTARAIFALVTMISLAAILGGLYYRLFAKADHERRFQRFRDETILMNAAYPPAHNVRQLWLLRPLPGTLTTRQKPKRLLLDAS
ncbi:hypothetical protein ACU8NH_18210 [Rhizobium leguminosarum]|uniref:hypothetical protein n=1 Tax=Rhizobium ruizarguesonis TaxID=2081791 RepID=UPI00103244D5|nr:hypothetical protein [Rhizobium ruizarguesonis]TBF29314.1 hypothetical protein ELG93_02460 [Rhizobium ruizarguesonis]